MARIELLVAGINPEPWRSPNLGTVRRGGRVTPAAYKDENLRAYQMGVAEAVDSTLAELGLAKPYFPAGTLLTVHFEFWRQLDSYDAGGKRRHVRHQADVTNMNKSTEDALQGILYANDRDNRRVTGELLGIGPDVEPGVHVIASPWQALDGVSVDWLAGSMESTGAKVDSTRTVWVQSG